MKEKICTAFDLAALLIKSCKIRVIGHSVTIEFFTTDSANECKRLLDIISE